MMGLINMKRLKYTIKFLSLVPDVETLHSYGLYQRHFILEELVYMFSWAQSPQGADYWRKRKDGVEPLSEEDLTFIKQAFLEAMSSVE